MEAVIAGWIAGFAMAIATTLALTFLAWRVHDTGLIDRFLDREVPVALVSVPISMGATIGWTMVGLVMGSVYRVAGFDDETWPPASWYVGIVALGVLPLPPLLLLWPRHWWLWLAMSGLFVALFGALMPPLAGR